MKKSIWIFLLAVLLPSVVLGWLALRSAEEQQIILEKRTAELYQKETENAAGAVRALIDGERRAFNDAVRRLLANKNPAEAARDFSAELAAAWPRKAVGFALGKEGRLISPSTQSARRNAEGQKFLLENSAFLCSAMPATVYWVSGDDLNRPDLLRKKNNAPEPQLALRGSTAPQPQPPQITLSGKGQNTISISATANVDNAANGTNGTTEASEKALREAPGAAAIRGPTMPAAVKDVPAAPAPAAVPDLDSASAPASPAAGASAPAPATAIPAAPPPAGKALDRTKDGGKSPDAFKAVTRSAAPPEKKARAVIPLPGGVKPLAGIATIDGGLRKDAEIPKSPEVSANPAKMAPAGPPAPMEEPRLPKLAAGTVSPEAPSIQGQMEPQSNVRNVAPQRMPDGDNNAVLSQIMPSTADFRTLTAGVNEGVITRFVQDQLDVLFWVRPAQDPDTIFGCLIASENLGDLWPAALPAPDATTLRERFAGRGGSEFILALLDDKARPVATQPPGEKGRDWKRPFVASEIGEALPHWEAALYLQRPEQLRESAVAVRRTLTFLIAGALGAIACGGWLVVADARRQLALAQQKADFVSNVSHELKTPLTSIRMFAELMQSGRPGTEAKHPQYLRIIMVEAERLTRLINNVLDFARIERRQKRFDKKPLDLHEVIGRIWEGHELHLREAGFSTRWEAAPGPYPVIGDDDALAQILVNLLSNAEKYSGERKEVELHSYVDGARVCVSVLDRGMGVPAGEERKIFEAFYRAHDSLSSGIQGSGLGLTLAQRLAREHGGEVLYQAREGGGSNFTLRVPLAPQTSPSLV
jgi:signal transduction histidine kinase